MKSMEMLLLIFSVLIQMSNSQEDWPCGQEIFCKPNQGILHQVQMKEIFQVSKLHSRWTLIPTDNILGFQDLCRHASEVLGRRSNC